MVRAKFRCTDVQPQEDGSLQTASFLPVTSGSKENEQFFKLTPGGNILLSVVSPSVSNEFEVGAEYFVDFTKTK